MEDRLREAVQLVHVFIGGASELGDALRQIASLATDALDVDMAGLTLNEPGGRARTVVYTDRMVPEIDQAQYDSNRGPCLDAFRTQTEFFVEETETEYRWPEYASSAAEHGIHSSLSIPVVVGDVGIGALNFYDARSDRFGESEASAGRLFAGQAAVVAAHYDKAEAADHMRRAMESRATIEQAKGVIMATSGCSPDEAFDILRAQSQAENRKVREIAEALVELQQRRRRDR